MYSDLDLESDVYAGGFNLKPNYSKQMLLLLFYEINRTIKHIKKIQKCSTDFYRSEWLLALQLDIDFVRNYYPLIQTKTYSMFLSFSSKCDIRIDCPSR